jgi:hypothetical protein
MQCPQIPALSSILHTAGKAYAENIRASFGGLRFVPKGQFNALLVIFQ